MSVLKRAHDIAYASTWGWYLPDWPNFQRPVHKDRWFLASTGLALCVAVGFLMTGQYLPAVLTPILMPLASGGTRRLFVGTNERDKAHRIRERMDAASRGA